MTDAFFPHIRPIDSPAPISLLVPQGSIITIWFSILRLLPTKGPRTSFKYDNYLQMFPPLSLSLLYTSVDRPAAAPPASTAAPPFNCPATVPWPLLLLLFRLLPSCCPCPCIIIISICCGSSDRDTFLWCCCCLLNICACCWAMYCCCWIAACPPAVAVGGCL